MFEFISSVIFPKLSELLTDLMWTACAAMLAYIGNKLWQAA
jgi:hypothetical protein